ncbi:hypothetical protein D3C80_1337300 [compost metagenome]
MNDRSVHMAAVGAPCSLVRPRYFGSQPSTDAWYRVREDPDIEVMIASKVARTSMINTILATTLPPPMLSAMTWPTPMPL